MFKTEGVFHHRPAIQQALREEGSVVMAELRIEEIGQYAGAVRVYVGSRLVGSIAHEMAEDFRAIVRRLNESGQPTTCHAEIELDYYTDVWLSAKPTEREADEPFLPEIGVGAQIALSTDGSDYVNELLGPRAKNKRIKPVAAVEGDSGNWTIVLNEHPIGKLEPGSYGRLIEARKAGFPLTARLLIVRQEGRPLRAGAGFPLG